MNTFTKAGLGGALLAAALVPGTAIAAESGAGWPEVSYAVRHDTSPPLAQQPVRRAPDAKPNREIPIRVPLDLAARAHPAAPGPDPLVGLGEAFAVRTPSPLLSFEGLSDDDNAAVGGGRIVPPDTEGDVGLTDYLQAINLILAVYNKATGARTFGPVPVSSLWVGFGGICEDNNDGDPIVLYDDAADRWLVSQFAIGADGHQCIAISQTSNPAGAYHRYDFVASPGAFNDYPKLGVWPDGYYMSANEFEANFVGAIAVAFERDKMLNGQAAQMVRFGPLACGSECFFSIQPSHFEGGTAPPAGAPNTFVMAFDDETWGTGSNSDGYRIWDFTVNWTSPGSSTFIVRPQVNAPEFDANLCNFSRNCIRQPSPGERLDPLGQFTMYRAQYRNFGTSERIVLNHTVDVGSNRAAVRWAELRDNGSGWVLHQTGTVSPYHRLALGGLDRHGRRRQHRSRLQRLQPDRPAFGPLRDQERRRPAGHHGLGGDAARGAGVQRQSFNRWGDYSTMSVDPADDCTFWYTQEYYANNGSFDFKTRIGSFKVPGCS